MSREVIIRIRDDIDGSDADETVTFSYRGEAYEIDLSNHHVELFDKDMKAWLEAARKVEPEPPPVVASKGRRKGYGYAPVPSNVRNQRVRIREWANASGFKVNDRGMIAAAVVESYRLAHPSVTLLPGVASNYEQREAAVDKVTAQQAEGGLIPVTDLMRQPYRDQRAERRSKADRDAIREWAVQHGYDQALTGMIKREVYEAYAAAHGEA